MRMIAVIEQQRRTARGGAASQAASAAGTNGSPQPLQVHTENANVRHSSRVGHRTPASAKGSAASGQQQRGVLIQREHGARRREACGPGRSYSLNFGVCPQQFAGVLVTPRMMAKRSWQIVSSPSQSQYALRQ